MVWATDLLHWSPFPWACDNVDYSRPIDRQYWDDDPDKDEYAFYCKFFAGHRGVTSECLGMNCPYCKIHGHQDFIEHLKGVE